MDKVLSAAVEYVASEVSEVLEDLSGNFCNSALFIQINEAGSDYTVRQADAVIAEARRVAARLAREAAVIREAVEVLESNRSLYSKRFCI